MSFRAGAGTPDPVPQGRATAGTGFFASWRGDVLTAAHVVRRCRRREIASPVIGRRPLRLVYADPTADVAVLRAELAPPAILPVDVAPPGAPATTTLGYGAGIRADAALRADGRLVNGDLLVGAADRRYVLWLQDPRIGPGWSGAPVLGPSGSAIGLVVSVSLDAGQTVRLFGRPVPGLVIGAGALDLRWAMDRAGAGPGGGAAVPSGPAPFHPARTDPALAVARILCWH